MAYAGQTLDNPVSGERITFRRTAADTNGELLEFDLTLAPDGHVPGAHVHPEQEERFFVHSGRMEFRLGFRKIVAEAGDSVIVPAGRVHKFKNGGDAEAQVRVQVVPALDMEELFETTVALAEEGDAVGAALLGEIHGGLEELLHVERRDDLHANVGVGVAAVAELVDAARRDDNALAGLGDDLAEAEAELHPPGVDVKALLLLGVNVGPGHVPVGGEREVELQQLAVGVGRGAPEGDPLTADRVVDCLSCVRHLNTPSRGGRFDGCRLSPNERWVVGLAR